MGFKVKVGDVVVGELTSFTSSVHIADPVYEIKSISPNDVAHSTMTIPILGLSVGSTESDTKSNIYVGCWVRTMFGPAVVTDVLEDWVLFRYRSIRIADGKTIWVANGQPTADVKFMRRSSATSLRVTQLRGPYGLG